MMKRFSIVVLTISCVGVGCLRRDLKNAEQSLSGLGDPATLAGLKAKTEACQAITSVGVFAEDRGRNADIPLCELPGAVFWKADFDIDCDGGSSANCKSDP